MTRLSLEERTLIEKHVKEKILKSERIIYSEIAIIIKRSAATIYNEFTRFQRYSDLPRSDYCAQTAQRIYVEGQQKRMDLIIQNNQRLTKLEKKVDVLQDILADLIHKTRNQG